MKANKWLKELVFLLFLALPWIIYGCLQSRLPAQIPSHYSPGPNGGWVADHNMPPLINLLILTGVMIFVYGLTALAPVLGRVGDNPKAKQWFFYFRLMLIGLFSFLTTYLLLSGAGIAASLSTTQASNLVMLVLLVTVNVMVYFGFEASRNAGKQPASEKNFNIIRASAHIVASVGPLIAILSAQGYHLERLMFEVIMLFFVVIGNLMYNLKPNYFVGVRTPWTLRNEDVWRKTHHFAGPWCFVTGLIGFVICVFAPQEILHYVLLIVALSIAIVSTGYSFIVYKKESPHH
jgi:uncharacterized membrane protein